MSESDRPGGASRRRPPDAPCLNCGDPSTGAYCPSCGQHKTNIHVSLAELMKEGLEDQLVLNRKLPRTLGALLFRPGFLTAEYVRGRVVRYVAPLRLYLVSSVVMFLVVSFVGLPALSSITVNGTSISADADSARAHLQQSRAELIAADTAGVTPTERAVLHQMIAGFDNALDAIPDTATVLNEATREEIQRRMVGSVAVDGTEMQPWAQAITVEARSGWLQRSMVRKVRQVGHLPPRQAFEAILADLLVYAPHMMFLLLPVYALLLKALYIRQDRYYAEHFIFALHVHAFVYAAWTLIFLAPWGGMRLLIMLSIIAYTWVAMRRFYHNGRLRTTAKWLVLGFVYFFAFLTGLLGLTVATLVLT